MPSLGDPKAVELLERLTKLIAVAEAAFRPGGPFTYPSQLNRLPRIVEQLQEFLGRRKPVRIPFWNCVKAVDERRGKLGLVNTLNDMVDRATSMAPGPLFRLLTECDKGALNAQEQEALLTLEQHLKDRPDHSPQNLKAYRSLLARVSSDDYRKVKEPLSGALISRTFHDLMDYAAYLDFRQQHYHWIDRYQEPLEDLFGLLLEFNSDHFYRQINRVLYGGTPKEANQKVWRSKAAARARTAKHRSKTKAPRSPVVTVRRKKP